MLAFCSSIMLPMPDNAAQAAEEPVPLGDPNLDGENVDGEEVDPTILAWLQSEMQMSIDTSHELQGAAAGWSCTQPPYNCPHYQRCDIGGGSVCKVNECGEGKCSFCPVNPPFRIVKSWCTYICMKGSTVVGGAFGFRLAGDYWYGPTCF
jgi:hypothetical protein